MPQGWRLTGHILERHLIVCEIFVLFQNVQLLLQYDFCARCDILSGLQLDCLPDKDMSCVRDYNTVVDAVTAQVKLDISSVFYTVFFFF